MVKLEVNRFDLDKISQMGKRAKKGSIRGMKKGMKIVLNEARSFSGSNQLNIRSGRLRDSIQTEVRVDGNDVVGFIGSDLIYSAIHEYGGTITARSSKYLIFKTNRGWRKVSSVNIPPRPYLRPAIENTQKEVEKILSESILNSIKGRVLGLF